MVALLLSLLPATRPAAVVSISVLAVLAPLLGIALHRPGRSLPWLAAAGMLTGWALSIAFGGRWPVPGEAAQDAGTVIGLGLLLHMFAQHVRTQPADRRTRERAAWGRRADQLALLLLVGSAAAQVITTAHADSAPPSAWWAPVDVVLAAVLLRFAFSRARLTPSIRLVIAGGVTAAGYDAAAATSGIRLQPLESWLSVIWAVSMALFVAAALHPSMATAFRSSELRRLRPESGRVLGLVALAPVPLALAALHPSGRLPWPVYLGTACVVAVLAIVRGSQALRSSEGHAGRDPLTGLANRRGLQIAFDELLLTARPGTEPVGRLALLDLDDFKDVNDTHGHEAGDHLLCAVGERLSAAVGTAGTVARSGGDEFVLVLHPDAPSVADVVATAFGAPLAVHGPLRRTSLVRCSAGWVPLTAASQLSLALADADIALYVSKGTHRGAATEFAPVQRADVLAQIGLSEDLGRLVAGHDDVGELTLVVQPLVDLRSRAVLGVEALVRWQHPTRGLLLPDTFLPVAEAQGHGAAVDTLVLRQACAVAAGWAARGLDRTVSVNLGRSSMVDPDLADRVRDALATTGLAPRLLHLEITEHDQLPVDAGVQALRELADLGVAISLDDFGTGYTSLAYLQRYPISLLKLDRSITGADAGDDLIAGITSLAGILGMAVLAEGIETEEQHARLAGFGIDSGQGWLYGRPVPAEQLDARPAVPLAS
ncbi:diguanylate cyclase (GGDEF) domain-containing protein [Klenkia soli]|uniref:Diguanylate cyclase (GGDEF) domain-containing protein n=1 Tax=Klenkia soli TaxID=1052260 RepID=A0A1H0Q027_9ACTN|nr:diguanylate cyclase (GGDEF) domain-containing protein [Klenkia soli]